MNIGSKKLRYIGKGWQERAMHSTTQALFLVQITKHDSATLGGLEAIS